MSEIDLAKDLPKVGDRQFWRVVNDGESFVLQLRYRYWHGGSKVVSHERIGVWHSDATPDETLRTAWFLLRRRKEFLHRHDLLGDYKGGGS